MPRTLRLVPDGCNRRPILPESRSAAALQRLHPGEHVVAVVSLISAELHMWDRPGPGVLPHVQLGRYQRYDRDDVHMWDRPGPGDPTCAARPHMWDRPGPGVLPDPAD